jgi:hypothetical protein
MLQIMDQESISKSVESDPCQRLLEATILLVTAGPFGVVSCGWEMLIIEPMHEDVDYHGLVLSLDNKAYAHIAG